jgi:hypothetical protein
MFLRNICIYLEVLITLHPRRPTSISLPPYLEVSCTHQLLVARFGFFILRERTGGSSCRGYCNYWRRFGRGGAILHDVNKYQPTVVIFKVLTAVEMVVLIFWVVARVDLQIDTSVSEKYIASIFRKVCSSETLLCTCMSTQRYNLQYERRHIIILHSFTK